MYIPYMQYFYPNPVIPSYVRIFHASPDTPTVDVYASGKLIAKNLKYKQFTKYLPFIPGKYSILVFPAGTTTTPIINTSLDVMPNSNYTVAITGMFKNIKPLVVLDTASPILPGKSQLKFVHLSPNTPMIDITLSDGTILFRNIEFKEISPNLMISPNNYTIQIRLAGTNKIILNAPNQLIKPNRYYTIYAVGLLNAKPPLQIITALDKSSY
ncbi:DUF4397 domain-containing protein [Crassaminicella thermophila]|uniref:DUF4397 domain-containing protein n=1 Tax=Crassaminicella thermophila TaxID=2599308 RepID=A0A5C0SEN0_CRATE|nr:DUF4397 domain-containing protein [Crassaminicella thermophila]QEK12781.1 DUF4397 domain-containing protein [Crassaminicella thermophila]